ncbi:MAG: hypothetical protein QG641_1152 [Candidatus Poribacteria bacterium]|nr:hypothetical protein [Candidatus Poribacteria bacterium]
MGTTLYKTYNIPKDCIITLTVTIGNGQRSNTQVYLDGKTLCQYTDSFEHDIPNKDSELDNKILFCSTIVADIQKGTNETSVTYELSDGVNTYRQILRESVDFEGDVKFYVAYFNFRVA